MICRRHFLKISLPALGLTLVGVGPALSETLEDKVVKGLRRQGYRDIKSGRTFLGRLRVTAEKGENRRELVLNRQTGEVLRDVIVGRTGGSESIFELEETEHDGKGSGQSDRNDHSGGGDDGGDHNDDGGDDDGGDD